MWSFSESTSAAGKPRPKRSGGHIPSDRHRGPTGGHDTLPGMVELVLSLFAILGWTVIAFGLLEGVKFLFGYGLRRDAPAPSGDPPWIPTYPGRPIMLEDDDEQMAEEVRDEEIEDWEEYEADDEP
jgi:hypothetical protein